MLNVADQKPKARIAAAPANNAGFMQVNSIEQALIVADLIAKSSFCPKSFVGKSGDIVVALQYGQELGLKPMQALQNISVINGRPSLWGDAMLAVCMQSPHFEYIKEEYIEETKTAVCRVKRKNMPEVVRKFSEADARRAKLWGKQGPWSDYPDRQQGMRARGFALRDAFADVLRGVTTLEEAEDIPAARDVTAERVDHNKSGSTVSGEIIITKGSTITKEQVSTLRTLIAKTDVKESQLCTHLKIESLENTPLEKWNDIYVWLKQKITKKQAIDSLAINQALDSSNGLQMAQ